MNPLRGHSRFALAIFCILPFCAASFAWAGEPAVIAVRHDVEVRGPFGLMRRVDSTTLILPDAKALLRAQRMKERRSAESEAARKGREAQSEMVADRKKADVEAAAKAGSAAPADAASAESAMAPSAPEPAAPAEAPSSDAQ